MILEQNPQVLKTVRGWMQSMEEEASRFNNWKKMAAPKVDYESKMKKKRKWVAKWTEKASRFLVAKAKKRSGQKKQEYLQDRAKRIKNR
jgi:hypothetical protein